MPASVGGSGRSFEFDTVGTAFVVAVLICSLGVGFELGGLAAGDPVDLPTLVAMLSGVGATGIALLAAREED